MHGMGGMSEPEKEVIPTVVLPDEHDEMGMVAFAAGHEAGEYEGEMVVTGPGEWMIRVHLTVDNRLIEFDFPLHVAGPQAGSNILLGFFAINAVILGAAVALSSADGFGSEGFFSSVISIASASGRSGLPGDAGNLVSAGESGQPHTRSPANLAPLFK